MKRIQYGRYGGPEEMRLEDFQTAPLEAGEVSVEVKVAAINPIDWKLREGRMKIVTGRSFPRAMGIDFSGIVTGVGPKVTRVKAGEAVFGVAPLKDSGALGQGVVTKESFVARKPDNVSFEDAACFGTPGITAWNGLVDKAKLKAGHQVFINGCGGAVGEAAVQIAHLFGAHVSGSCSARDMERMKTLGVEAVYDYRITDLSRIETRFDIVYDTAATMTASAGVGLLRSGGTFLDLNPGLSIFIRSIFDRRVKIVINSPRADILEQLATASHAGNFHIPIGETVPLDAAIQLITDLEKGRKLGGKGLVAMD